MTTPDNWRKSSYTGGGEGNACVEIATHPTQISVRDSKIPTGVIVTFTAGVFTAFVRALKPTESPAGDFARVCS
ncbi:DUF397 domain-containing protein [Streptomyces sp. NPDC056716]|uniref:DUF397 domain-containing protein n=1 Tax=unclassified Streptomyces TaxID=2593676 RepID=UPI0036B97158